MAKHRWSIACYRPVVDKYNNHLSILEVTEELRFRLKKPLDDPMPPNAKIEVSFHVVSLWDRTERDSPETFWSRASVFLPGGEERKLPTWIEGNLQGKVQRTRLMVGFGTLPFNGPGVYEIGIFLCEKEGDAGELVARIPLDVIIAEDEPEPEQDERREAEDDSSSPPG